MGAATEADFLAYQKMVSVKYIRTFCPQGLAKFSVGWLSSASCLCIKGTSFSYTVQCSLEYLREEM